MSAGISLATAAAAVGVVGGTIGIANALGGGGGGGGGGAAPQAYDPYAQYRPQAAQDLQALMKDPSQARSQPGYQQQLQEGTRTAEAAAAASGKLQSGQESAALQSLGQGTFANYYQTMLANLAGLSGASQNPAQAQAAAANAALNQQQAAGIKQQMFMGGLQTLMSGATGLQKANNLSPSYNLTQYGTPGMGTGSYFDTSGTSYDAMGNPVYSGYSSPSVSSGTSGSSYYDTSGTF